MNGGWIEVGERVLVRRYAFYDQNIVAVAGLRHTLVLDTRTTGAQAREVLDDLRGLGLPPVGIVVNSHGHYDHAFGNRAFRPAPIYGHERCAAMIVERGEAQRAETALELPELAAELAEVVLDPPDRTFADALTIDLDGRRIDLAYLGRGHTDNDIVLAIPDADILCAGDLLENDAAPSFGDAFPLDWPATARALLARCTARTVVVPGHGRHAGYAFAERSVAELEAIALLARRVHAGTQPLDDAVREAPYPAGAALDAIDRALAQLRGELDGG